MHMHIQKADKYIIALKKLQIYYIKNSFPGQNVTHG